MARSRTVTKLAPGQVQFFDNHIPALSAGPYTLTATPTISDPHKGTTFPDFPATQQALQVVGPHYTLDPSLVYSMFPPPNGASDYAQYLPQIVLRHPTLPWLRLIQNGASPETPWLALLLFSPSEAGGTATSRTLAQTGPVSAVLKPPAGYAQPENVSADPSVSPTSQCQFVDLPAALFGKIAPSLTELPYVAHYRETNTKSDVVEGDSENGTFSVVIGNRLPSQSERNIVHLVSLEGYVGYLPGAPSKAFQTIRLVSLASWTFDSKTIEQFKQYMQGLSLHPPMLQLPVPQTDTTPAEKTVQTALGKGYTLLDYDLRDGEKTAAWYRGPLAAEAVAPAASTDPFETSDAALVYDKSSGLFDVSCAIAWQVGRLLALADPKFCTALIAYRRELTGAAQRLDARQELAAHFSAALTPPHREVALDPRAMHTAARDFLFTRLPHLMRNELAPLLAPRDRRGLEDRLDKLPAVLPQAELIALLESGEHPVTALLRRFLPGRLPVNAAKSGGD